MNLLNYNFLLKLVLRKALMTNLKLIFLKISLN